MNLINLNLNFIFLLSLLSPSLSCNTLIQAFSSVSNFPLLIFNNKSCNQIHELILPSKNLSGPVSWAPLANISSLRSIDLSGNSLQGSIPGAFWSMAISLASLNIASNRLGGPLRFDATPSPSLTSLNLSGNRFTAAFGVSGLSQLRSLDLSRNSLASVPAGLGELQRLIYLDVSCNSMSGAFPTDFPPVSKLRYLNISFNNLTGVVSSSVVAEFGSSAFAKAGSLAVQKQQEHNNHHHHHHHHQKSDKTAHKNKKRVHRTAILVTLSVLIVVVVVVVLLILRRRRKRLSRKAWKEEEKGVKAAEEVSGWVAEARWAAPVVMFEKPLMELMFSDLAAATSGFGKETQLAEAGRSGPMYRATLPGDMQVVVRVAEGLRGAEEREAAAGFRELARLRHPNLLPLLGYCIAGREKLLLYEYMERGDLHQWLHELPAGHPDDEDWTGETWEPNQTTTARTSAMNWPTRHRTALGIARGLAFLHQGWAGSRQPIVHGHLVPSNILLDENLEPRIADFATGGGGETTESNVYSFGVLVMELVTGRGKWTSEEVEKVRKSVRDGNGLKEVDFRMSGEEGSEGKWEKEMVECLRIGYLCTAQSPEKRPTMQQVVGLLKDIRPLTSNASVSCV